MTPMRPAPIGRLAAAVLTAWLHIAPAALYAQEAQDMQDAPADDLTMSNAYVPFVPPTGMQQSVRDTPASITVLSAEMLANYGVLSVFDAVRLVAGVPAARLNGANMPVRFEQQSFALPPRLAVLIDGTEVYRPPFADVGDWSTLPVSIDDIDRIEVTRGSHTAGQGPNSVLVIVNIVTKHPADVERGYFRVTAGSYDTLLVTARAGATLGATALRFTAAHRQRGPVDDAIGVGQPQRQDTERLTLRTETRFTADATLAVDAAYMTGRRTANAPLELARDEVHKGYASVLWTQRLGSSHELRLRLDHWSNSLRTFPIDCAARADAGPLAYSASPQDLSAPEPASRIRAAAESCAIDKQHERRSKLELQDTFAVSESLRLVGGVGLRQEKHSNDAPQRKIRQAFGGVEWRPAAPVVVNVGAYTDDAANGHYEPALRAGVNLHLSPEQTLRVAWSTGTWAPEVDSPPIPAGATLRTMERIETADLGYLLHAPSMALRLDGRLFWTRLTDRVWIDLRSGNQISRRTDGELYGIELRANSQFSDDWSGFAGLTSMTEGGGSPAAGVWSWGGVFGLSTTFGAGWRVSLAYAANSQIASSEQSFGRADLTISKSLLLYGARARAMLIATHYDHLRTEVRISSMTSREGSSTASACFAVLQVGF